MRRSILREMKTHLLLLRMENIYFFSEEVDGKWTTPRPMPFSSTYTDRDFTMSPDGQRMYFGSNRSLKEGATPLKSLDIWVTIRGKNNTWEQPVNLDYSVNTPEFGENYPSVVFSGEKPIRQGKHH